MDNDELLDIKKRLESLENKLLASNSTDMFVLDKRAMNNDIITKSYRVHESAIKEFNTLIKTDKFKIYSVQDLVSQAFWEFCENHKSE